MRRLDLPGQPPRFLQLADLFVTHSAFVFPLNWAMWSRTQFSNCRYDGSSLVDEGGRGQEVEPDLIGRAGYPAKPHSVPVFHSDTVRSLPRANN